MTAYGILVGEATHQLLIFLLFAEETIDGTFVGLTFVHRNDGIEQDGEVGTLGIFGMGGDSGSQMATSRESHDAHILRIDMPYKGRVANGTDGRTGIAQRNLTVALRHAISQHEIGNALLVEVLGPVMSLVLHGQMAIAATGAAYDGTAGRLLWQIGHHVRLSVRSDVDGELSRGLCLHRHGDDGREDEEC